MSSEELIYAMALRSCPMIGDSTFRKMLAIAGSAKEAWELSGKELSKIRKIRKSVTESLGNPVYLEKAIQEIEFCEKNNIKIIYALQEKLPGLLSECEDAPVFLFQKGNFDREKNNISIVGTRNITSYGRKFVHGFLEAAKEKSIQTISGLALGVDTCVHEESLHFQIPTVAVIAHGFHLEIYPAKNRKLAEKILENQGAIFSEYSSQQSFIKENFIQRNRIVAGISPSTCIVETAFRGGAISTATFANNYNREVYALPGDINHKYSQGCNLLIAQNKASAIVDIAKLITDLGFQQTKEKQLDLFEDFKDYSKLDKDQKSVIEVIIKTPGIQLEELSEEIGIASYRLLPILLTLELETYIKTNSSKQYFPI
ncbi:DNA-processing protein DprA [Elizabethkingia sp. JS20170427COW]|uniref:DNA-processing protein DprA n=1 Tax=Elizabethkingia sp. JS20170427COW TaxID=2583851 RepID=UPI001110B04B|nr:DNA-processing protein DprA [Elizabethkingia sp. JS20170427COW]QCX53006.1 DNA-protecting protein DprA [Elizabethkingia sp. JS20170427COW]